MYQPVPGSPMELLQNGEESDRYQCIPGDVHVAGPLTCRFDRPVRGPRRERGRNEFLLDVHLLMPRQTAS